MTAVSLLNVLMLFSSGKTPPWIKGEVRKLSVASRIWSGCANWRTLTPKVHQLGLKVRQCIKIYQNCQNMT